MGPGRLTHILKIPYNLLLYNHTDTEWAGSTEATPVFFFSFPSMAGHHSNVKAVHQGVPAGCSVLSLCSRHMKKSFTIDIVGDIKSMQAEGSSGEEKAKPVTQEDIRNLPRSHPAEKTI